MSKRERVGSALSVLLKVLFLLAITVVVWAVGTTLLTFLAGGHPEGFSLGNLFLFWPFIISIGVGAFAMVDEEIQKFGDSEPEDGLRPGFALVFFGVLFLLPILLNILHWIVLWSGYPQFSERLWNMRFSFHTLSKFFWALLGAVMMWLFLHIARTVLGHKTTVR